MEYEDIVEKLKIARDIWESYEKDVKSNWDFSRPVYEYERALWKSNEYMNYYKLSLLERLNRPSELIVMREPDKWEKKLSIPINEFLDSCRYSCFTDYDGSGNYGTADMISDIEIDIEDMLMGNIRKDFTHIWWYNK